ncbi:MAG: ribonuclease P protein component [Elusimicrobiota bacterium]
MTKALIDRIKSAKEFSTVIKTGQKTTTGSLIIYFTTNEQLLHSKLGILIKGRLANAVKRNRMKRLVREAFRAQYDRIKTRINIVVCAKKDFSDLKMHDIAQELCEALEQCKII